MSIPEHRLSTQVVEDEFIPPDERDRYLLIDYEQGPIALNDNSAGVAYQPWTMTYNPANGQFTLTPETTGSPVVVLTVMNVSQLSFAFDQNSHVTIAYTANGLPYLYWYDSVAGDWVTDLLAEGVTSPTLTMDDKRITQSNSNDVVLWYTKQEPDLTWRCYTREQRDRFTVEYPMGPCEKWIYKCGMHEGLRLQVTTRAGIL